MAISRTFPLYVNSKKPGDPLLIDAASSKRASNLVITQGDTFKLRIYFVSTPGDSPTYVVPASTDTIILAASVLPSDEVPVFLIDSWTRTATYIEATFDANADDEVVWLNATQTSRALTCDLKVRDQGNVERITYQFPILFRRQAYGGSTAPDTITPYLDLTAALGIFLAYDRAQSLDTEEKDQVAANAGLLRNATQSLTPAQQILVRANFSGGLATLTGNSTAPYISQTAMADIPIAEGSVTSAPCTATGLFPGMVVNTPDSFIPGTTIESISGVAPNQTVTFSDPALSSGTQTITASTTLALNTFNPASPGTIGGNTPGAATFTTLNIGSGTAKFAFTTTTLTQTNSSGVQVLRATSTGKLITQGGLDLTNNETTQGIYGTFTGITGYDDSNSPTFSLFSATGAATLTGDLWLGAYSGTGQGILLSRTGLFGYDSSSGNTLALDPATGTADVTTLIAATITIGGSPLTLGGNVYFTSVGRALANAADAPTAAAAIGAATLTGTQTLTNKTLTAPALTAPAIPSTDTTGYTIFNTVDQVTNYERGRIYYASNTLYFGSEKGGTGTVRDIRVIAGGNQYFEVKNLGSTTGGFRLVGLTTSTANAIGTNFSSWGSSATSGTNIGINWAATYNQTSGTAANTDLLFNRTETAVGSGAQNLFDFQVGGSSKGRLTNKGVFLPSGAVVLPAYTVATLPATAALGMVAGAVVAVTDALAPAWNTALVGGGAVHCGARYNGAAWVAC